ncbi:MAG TPA: FAD-binding protein, partial [Candidatus Saccharimonadales bacterium]|nr:FAD-binding protein [Candidatus Saccharimonadales bacterium]
MDAFYRALKQAGFEGDIDDSAETKQFYSHDASLFELLPQTVVFPMNADDLERLVRAVNQCRGEVPGLSLTARSAGTDMSGGAVNDSIIVDFRRYFTKIGEITDRTGHVQPGV